MLGTYNFCHGGEPLWQWRGYMPWKMPFSRLSQADKEDLAFNPQSLSRYFYKKTTKWEFLEQGCGRSSSHAWTLELWQWVNRGTKVKSECCLVCNCVRGNWPGRKDRKCVRDNWKREESRRYPRQILYERWKKSRYDGVTWRGRRAEGIVRIKE